jgi:hypothetical protein
MTTGLTLGRIGHDIDGVAGAKKLSHDGDQVDLTVGFADLASAADAKAVRQQILGYTERGTAPVLPLTWDVDSDVDGYYRLRSAAIETNTRLYNARDLTASFSLERIRGYSAPLIESIYTGAARSFVTSGAASVKPWVALPSTWRGESETLGRYIFSGIRLISPTLGMRNSSNGLHYGETILSHAEPTDFYDGAVTFRSGPGLHVVTGRQVAASPSDWSLDNGLVKIVASEDSASMFSIYTRLANGTGWSTRAKRLVVYENAGGVADDWPYGAGTYVTPLTVSVIKNAPEEVAIALRYPYDDYDAPSTGALGAVDVRISLRRGARVANVSISSSTASTYGMRYTTGFTGPGVFFSHDGGLPNHGVIEPATDVDGQKSLIFNGSASMTLSASGRTRLSSSATTVDVGVGSEVSPGDAEDVHTALLAQYLAAQSEVQRVVAR